MDVDVPGPSGERPEETMLVVAVPKLHSCPLERLGVKVRTGKVGRAHLDVDDRLSCQAGHRGRADVLNPLTSIAELRRKPRLPSGVAIRPGPVVGHYRWRVVEPAGTFGLLEA
jgi:hypothetical protein